MSHLSRFDLSFDKPEKPLPLMPEVQSELDAIDQLAKDICALDSELAEILFSASFSTKSRDERNAQIRDWQ